MKTLQVLDYTNIDDFLSEIFNEVVNESDYTSLTVVAESKLANELLHRILTIKDAFCIADVEEPIDGYCYVTIDSDFNLYCKPVCINGKYVENNATETYIQGCVPHELEKYLGNDFKIVFDINE